MVRHLWQRTIPIGVSVEFGLQKSQHLFRIFVEVLIGIKPLFIAKRFVFFLADPDHFLFDRGEVVNQLIFAHLSKKHRNRHALRIIKRVGKAEAESFFLLGLDRFGQVHAGFDFYEA